MRLDKDKIKSSLTEKDVVKVLKDLGSSTYKKDSQGRLMFKTVCHGGDSHKLYYYPDSKNFQCYTGCGNIGDIYELVITVKNNQGFIFKLPQAVKYVANITGKFYESNFYNEDSTYLTNDLDWIERYNKTSKTENIVLPEYNRHILEVFVNRPHEEWIKDNISIETMEKYQIGYYIREDRITIPHFDINNRLIGVRGRTLLQEEIDAGRKYMPVTVQGINLRYLSQFNLFGINHTKKAVKRFKKCMIVEAEKGVMQCDTYFGENNFTVAVMGSTVKSYQRDMILNMGVEEVFIAMDKMYTDVNSDEAYEYAQKLLKIAKQFVNYCRTYILWDTENLLEYKDSPTDKGKEILLTLMKNKYEITNKNYEKETECDID